MSGTNQQFDEKSFSVRTVPDSWVEAQKDSGVPDPTPLTSRRSIGVVPLGGEADVLTGTLAGLAISVVVGVSWFAFESQDVVNSPWLAVLAAVLIAVGVRLGVGADHSDIRATISLIFYIVTLFVVAYFIERYDYLRVYGVPPGFQEAQTELVRDRLTEPRTLLAWSIGVFANLQTGYLLRRRLTRTF